MRKIFLLIFLVILSVPCVAQFELGGYYENQLVGGFKRTNDPLLGDLNRLRLRLGYMYSENISLHLEPEYDLLAQTGAIPLSGVSGLDQLTWDRAYLKVSFPAADLTAGKQRIAWGAGYLWNPTDVFNPFTMSFAVAEESEQEPTAVRLEVPLGPVAGIDTYIVTDAKWEETAKGIRAITNLGMYDLSASYVDRGRGAFQLGFDTTGELFDFGVRSEIAYVSPATSESYFQLMAGWNYTLENGWGLDMEYYYNGLGKRKKEDYDWTGLYAGQINQLGRDYLYFDLHKMLDEITGIRFSLLTNLDDLSYLIYPSFSRNIFQNVDLSLEAMLTGGQSGSEFYPTDAQDPSGLSGSKLLLARIKYSF
ncbi:hypothetical protein ACFL1W_01860 [Candidatus Margulisiibacteriota bacterium]